MADYPLVFDAVVLGEERNVLLIGMWDGTSGE
jgi:hypothetical protein